MGDVLTYHVDSARTGLKSAFPFAPVGGTWRRYVEIPTGAPVRAAPLFLSQYTFVAGPNSGQTHDVLVIAAADNRVYAYSENLLISGAPNAQLWVQQGLGPASPRTGSNIPPPVGICGTPVIDRPNGLIYVMAYVHGASSDAYTLFVLDINTGAVLDQALLVDAGAPGRPTFDPTKLDQRGGLNLVNGWIFATFADFLKYDADTYYGWIVACNQTNLSQQLFLPSTLTATKGGGMWGPGGAAAGPDGTLYASTGNGINPTYQPGTNPPQPQAGDDFEGVIHVQLTGAPALKVLDHYQPTWAKTMNDQDQDFGGSSPLVVSIGGQTFVITTAKDGNIYLLGSTLPGFGGELWTSRNNGGLFNPESKTAPAYFHDAASGNDFVYVTGSGPPGIAAFTIDAANNKLVPAWNAGLSFGDGPGSPFIISEPTTNAALVWVVDGVVHNDNKIVTSPTLYAFNAVSGALAFHSDAVAGNGIGDNCPNFAPIVAAAQSVFVGALTSVVGYLNVPPTLSMIIVQSTFGQNEVDLGLPAPSFPQAGYVQLDGFSPSDIGPLNSPTVALTFAFALDPTLPSAVSSAINAMNLQAAFAQPVLPLDPALPAAPQGFWFPFTVSFANNLGYQAMLAANITSTNVTVTATMLVKGLKLQASGQVQLTTGEDPRFVDVNPKAPTQFPTWLSFDLRFFKVLVPPNATGPVKLYGGSIETAADAPGFIASALPNITNAIFDGLSQDEELDQDRIPAARQRRQSRLQFRGRTRPPDRQDRRDRQAGPRLLPAVRGADDGEHLQREYDLQDLFGWGPLRPQDPSARHRGRRIPHHSLLRHGAGQSDGSYAIDGFAIG